MFVFDLTSDELKQVALNKVTAEKEIFWGTPAVSNGNLVLRSAKYVYCVADKGETVGEDDDLMVKAEAAEKAKPAEAAGGGQRSRGRQRFDPAAMFDGMDSDKDGKLSEEEIKASRFERMADRVMTLDKDGDEAVSKEEFTTGIRGLFSGGRGGRGGARKDSRPERPQRPSSGG